MVEGENKADWKSQLRTSTGGGFSSIASQGDAQQLIPAGDSRSREGGGGTKSDELKSDIVADAAAAHSVPLSPVETFLQAATNFSISSAPHPPSLARPEYEQLMSKILDFKVDMKLEIQRMNSKISHVENLMTDFISKLNSALPPQPHAANPASIQSG